MYDNIQNIKLAQAGSEEAMEKLITNNSGLVWNIVKRFTGRGYESEDLYQLGEIKRFIRDDGIIKVSRQIKELTIKIKQLQKQYLNQKGEEISINELAEILEVSKEEIAAAIESTNPVDSIYSNENSSEDRSLIEKIPNKQDEYKTLIDKISISETMSELNKREKEIILLRFYKEQTQSQVGKILGITQVQVSRIEKKVLEKMRNKLEAV